MIAAYCFRPSASRPIHSFSASKRRVVCSDLDTSSVRRVLHRTRSSDRAAWITHHCNGARPSARKCAAADGLKNCLWKSVVTGIHQLQTVKVVAIPLRQQQAPPQAASTCSQIWMLRSDSRRCRAAGSIAPCVGGAGGGDDRHDPLAVSLRLRNLRLAGRTRPSARIRRFSPARYRAVAEAHQRHVLLHREVGVFRAQDFVLADILGSPSC